MPKMTFINPDGTRLEVDAPVGLSVLEIAHRNNISLEGACEGSLACSTCHVIVDPEWYDVLQTATEDEEDMLDLAFGLTHTSRLGCQIKMTEELDGLDRQPADGDPQHDGRQVAAEEAIRSWTTTWRKSCAGPTSTTSRSSWRRRVRTSTSSTCDSPTCGSGCRSCRISRTIPNKSNEKILEAIQAAWIEERG